MKIVCFTLLCLSIALVSNSCIRNDVNTQFSEPTFDHQLNPTKSLPTDSISSTTQPTEITPNEEMMESIINGNEIVEALNSYYQQNHDYPATLDKLEPTFISEIPTTITGQEYKYQLLTNNNVWGQPYLLIFYLQKKQNVNCSYIERLKDWDCSGSYQH